MFVKWLTPGPLFGRWALFSDTEEAEPNPDIEWLEGRARGGFYTEHETDTALSEEDGGKEVINVATEIDSKTGKVVEVTNIDRGMEMVKNRPAAYGDRGSRLEGVKMIPASQSPTLARWQREIEADRFDRQAKNEAFEAAVDAELRKRREAERLEREVERRTRLQ